MPVVGKDGLSGGRSVGRSVGVRSRDYQIFSDGLIISFWYPWCSPGALRARELRYHLTLTIPRKTNLTHFVVIEPNAPPVNVQGHNTSSTSIWVNWDTVPVVDQNGIVLTYTVTYTAFPGSILRTAIVKPPTTHVTLESLEEYTNYSILVFASTVKGDGNASDPIIVTTDEDSKLPQSLRYLTILKEEYVLLVVIKRTK